MKVLVTGGREYKDREKVYGVLDRLHAARPITVLAQGKAHGADMLADHWAIANRVSRRGFQAEWDRYGPRAGFIRNVAMFDAIKPDLVVAFPGGTGTANMISVAKTALRVGAWYGFIMEIA